MKELVLGSGIAFWLGILTSISPCPLVTNIAAISFVGRGIGRPGRVLLTGLLYTAGRATAYTALAVVLVNSLLSAPGVSHWLQKYMHGLLGPVLVVAAMALLDMLPLTAGTGGAGRWFQKRADKFGLAGAFVLGAVFAVSFCPVSAALFFGSLIPLSIKNSSGLMLPIIYGVGTALPVIGFGFAIAAGADALGRVFEKTAAFRLWAQRITGIVFLLAGIYLTLAYTIGAISF